MLSKDPKYSNSETRYCSDDEGINRITEEGIFHFPKANWCDLTELSLRKSG
jgi:hypothetical protein